jgi:hypothetical protein
MRVAEYLARGKIGIYITAVIFNHSVQRKLAQRTVSPLCVEFRDAAWHLLSRCQNRARASNYSWRNRRSGRKHTACSSLSNEVSLILKSKRACINPGKQFWRRLDKADGLGRALNV